jgi:hypothetical protein
MWRGLQYEPKKELISVEDLQCQNQTVHLKLASWAETCNLNICNKGKRKHQPELHIDR